ncbi:MAG: oligosaccharide flippase family protein, partial [Rhodospirillales bacterium]|nr:oligosaccharide flippase family protein [Rhodospirillales bacterium]
MSHEKPCDFKSMSGHMARGALWMVGMRWSLKAVGAINTVILARLLAPDDFGVIAMATIVVGFVEMLADCNVDMALLRNPNATREHYNSAWTGQIMMGAIVTALLCLLARPMAAYYGDPRVETVMYIVSFRGFIMGWQNIGVVDFRRNLEFSKEFRYWVYRRLSMF